MSTAYLSINAPAMSSDTKPITALLAIIVVFVVGVVLYQLSTVLLPFVVALLLSFIFKPPVLWLIRHKVPKALALLAVVASVGVILFGVTMMIVPNIDSFIQNVPGYQDRLTKLAEGLIAQVNATASNLGAESVSINISDVINMSTVSTIVTASLGSLVTSLSNGFLVFLFLLFLLAGSGDLAIKVQKAFSSEHATRIATIVENIDKQVRHYLVAKSIISLAVGIITTIILLALGIDFAVVWGLLAFLLNYIPNFGSLVATIFPVLIALVQYPSPTRAFVALILLVVSQNIIGNVIEPKVMQFSLNLSPVLILLMLIFWGWIWGVVGMILAVPITATIKIVCENVDALRPIAVLMSGQVIASKVPRSKGLPAEL